MEYNTRQGTSQTVDTFTGRGSHDMNT